MRILPLFPTLKLFLTSWTPLKTVANMAYLYTNQSLTNPYKSTIMVEQLVPTIP